MQCGWWAYRTCLHSDYLWSLVAGDPLTYGCLWFVNKFLILTEFLGPEPCSLFSMYHQTTLSLTSKSSSGFSISEKWVQKLQPVMNTFSAWPHCPGSGTSASRLLPGWQSNYWSAQCLLYQAECIEIIGTLFKWINEWLNHPNSSKSMLGQGHWLDHMSENWHKTFTRSLESQVNEIPTNY